MCFALDPEFTGIGHSTKNNENVFKYVYEHDMGVDYVNFIDKRDIIRVMWDKMWKLSKWNSLKLRGLVS